MESNEGGHVVENQLEIMLSTLTRTQQESTRLVLENRQLREDFHKLLKTVDKALTLAGELLKEKAERLCVGVGEK